MTFSKEVERDLTATAIQRCETAIEDILQLVDDPTRRLHMNMMISGFILARCVLEVQDAYREDTGKRVTFDQSIGLVLQDIVPRAKIYNKSLVDERRQQTA